MAIDKVHGKTIILIGLTIISLPLLFFFLEHFCPYIKDHIGLKENYRFTTCVLFSCAEQYWNKDINWTKDCSSISFYLKLFFFIGFGALILYLIDIFIPLFSGLIWSLCALYFTHIGLFSVAIVLIFLTVAFFIFKSNHSAFLLAPKIRFLAYFIVQFTPIFLLVCFLYLLYLCMIFDNHSRLVLSLICSIILIIPYSIYLFSSKETLFFVIPYRKYTLFLRAFKDDEKIKIDRILSKYFKNLIEIGDPNSHEANMSFNGKTFYLPSGKWKEELQYYITRASYVFCNISNTDGVKWEMENHEYVYTKFIFYIKDVSLLSPLIEGSDIQKPIYLIFSEIKKIIESGPCTFIIRGNEVFYTSKIALLLIYLTTGKGIERLSLLQLDNKIMDELNVNTSHSFKYVIKDIMRYFWMLLRPTKLIKYLSAISLSGIGILIIFGIILAVTLIIFGIMTIFSIFTDENPNIFENLTEGVISCIIGIYLIKEFKD